MLTSDLFDKLIVHDSELDHHPPRGVVCQEGQQHGIEPRPGYFSFPAFQQTKLLPRYADQLSERRL